MTAAAIPTPALVTAPTKPARVVIERPTLSERIRSMGALRAEKELAHAIATLETREIGLRKLLMARRLEKWLLVEAQRWAILEVKELGYQPGGENSQIDPARWCDDFIARVVRHLERLKYGME